MVMQYYRVTRTRVITEIAEMSILEDGEEDAARSAKRYAGNESSWNLVSVVAEDEYVAEKE